MKKLYSFLTVFCLFVLFFAFTPSQAGAIDVWIDSGHDEYRGSYEIYVVTDSIKWNPEHTAVNCLTKEVQNGRMINVRKWYIHNFKDEWRYRTPEMRDRAELIHPNDNADKILQVCFNHL